MSSMNPDNPQLPEGLDLPSVDGRASPAARRRGAASVTLRQRPAEAEEIASLDPATKSLADALRITYRLLQLAMVVLIGLYLLSGFESVNQYERGIRLVFGRVTARDLQPGFQFSAPAPFGELVKVKTGLETQDIDKQFFPRLSDAEEKQLVDKDKGVSSLSGGTDSLDPDADGHLITADGNIAHARWSVTYQRADAGQAAANVDPDSERRIVAAATNRGIVRAAASLPIDDLLRKQAGAGDGTGGSRVETMAREAAQKALDEMESGLQITQLTMTLAMPPRQVLKAFQDVQAAESKRAKAMEEAQSKRNETLTQAAGEAARDLLALIDRYEADLARKDQAGADKTLETIQRVMMKEEVELDGRKVARVSGRVSQIIDDARQDRSSVVNRVRSDCAIFQAKLDSFTSNPGVMINADWVDAFTRFASRDNVQAMYLPPEVARSVVMLNRDPLVTRDLVTKAIQEQNKKADEERTRQRERRMFEERINASSKLSTE